MENHREDLKKRYRRYWIQFVFRILVLVLVAGLAVYRPGELFILEGMNFFKKFSVLHLLWLLWVWYMLEKLLPLELHQHRGSMKYRKSRFRPTKEYESRAGKEGPWEVFKQQKRWYAKGACLVFAAWATIGLILFWLKKQQLIGTGVLLMASALFYMGDLVCILIWCPFRSLFMKNRCCTQCRIYNWDTWMMILPLIFIRGFFSYSLLALAVVVAAAWEMNHLLHPERFYPLTNANLQCAGCKGEPGCYQVRKQKSIWWFLER